LTEKLSNKEDAISSSSAAESGEYVTLNSSPSILSLEPHIVRCLFLADLKEGGPAGKVLAATVSASLQVLRKFCACLPPPPMIPAASAESRQSGLSVA
jgi:hypothetical protein